MQKRNKVLAGVLTGALVLSAGPMALAATANYNDSSVTGGSAAWQNWVKEWETVATDYTKVSLTPGADETQLNFAWYSKTESGKAATPVVHFGTDKDHLTAFTGKAAQVDNSLTDGVAYDYNHVTVTGLEANTTYYYTVEKNGVQSEVQEYKTGSFDSVKMLYVGDSLVEKVISASHGMEIPATVWMDFSAGHRTNYWRRTGCPAGLHVLLQG